ncbi:MAG: nucleoside deaminase [Bacilli bacterium]|nr:nucleoside deaminase [Bacilli bacterium]
MDLLYIENELNKLIKKAVKKNEVPIAAIIIKNDKIIAKGYNRVNKKNNFMKHAEIIVIDKVMKKQKNWRLSDCTLYVTLEPCSMCKEIINKSRIKEVYYFIKQNNEKTENKPLYNYINSQSDFSKELKDFFCKKRKNNNVPRGTLKKI